MEHVRPRGKSVVEFTDQFKVKRNNVPKVMGKPTYSLCKPVLDATETNLINMEDPRDNIWKNSTLSPIQVNYLADQLNKL